MNVVAELNGSLDLLSKYVYTNGMLVGRIDSSGELYQYFHDGLGSTIMISDTTGEYQNLYVYDDFGNFRMMEESGSVSNHYYYTGQERDEEPSGLYNLRARYYAPGIGRFTQEDPLTTLPSACGIWQIDRYSYVGNNPINYVDPLGLWTTLPPNVSPDPVQQAINVIDGADPLPPLLLSDPFSRCWFLCMFGLRPMATATAFALGTKPVSKGVAMSIYHLRYPTWFSAWGKYSVVHVPRLAGKIGTGISILGWAWTAYDAYSCYNKCAGKDEKKSPMDMEDFESKWGIK